jgi:hypothetical protein
MLYDVYVAGRFVLTVARKPKIIARRNYRNKTHILIFTVSAVALCYKPEGGGFDPR